MMLSIVIPTLGRNGNIERLFASLGRQSFSHSVEVILSATHIAKDELLARLPRLPENFKVVVIESTVSGIAKARNKGLREARGRFLFFLDDDCALPDDSYLARAVGRLMENPNAGWAGSYLANTAGISFFSAFYNHVSNLWLKSFTLNDRASIVLGGCSLFSRDVLLNSAAFFEENADKAAEEFSFAHQLSRRGVPIFYCDSVSVIHDPSCSFRSLLQKSWNHGRALKTYPAGRPQKRWSTYFAFFRDNTGQSLRFLPLLVVFLGAGRIAFLLRRTEDTVSAIRRPYLKRS